MANTPFIDWIRWDTACAKLLQESGQPGPGMEMEPYLLEALREGVVRARRTDTNAELFAEFWREGVKHWETLPDHVGIEINRNDLNHWLFPPSDQSKRRPGRRPEIDWEECLAEIARFANTPNGLPDTQSEMVDHLEDWFEHEIGKSPARSGIEERVSRVYRRAFPDK